MRSARHFNPTRSAVALLACLLSHAWLVTQSAEKSELSSGGASIEWPANNALAFHSGDTLELTLRLPASVVENAPEDAQPTVGIWLKEPDAKEPTAEAPQAGRVLVLRSARPGEWIVQVRGISAAKENVSLELLARWSFAKPGAAPVSGELRYPGRVAFGSKPVDIVLLMDGSWSMELSDPKRKRVAAVRDFIATARNSAAIGRVGIVQFDSKSKTLIGLTPVAENFDKAIEAIGTNGMTDIDGGVRHALSLIEPEHRNGAAIVLFTDGVQEPGVYGNAHLEAQKAGVAIHTMTLGVEADRPLLKRIAEETGGSYADADKDNDISAAYAAIVSRITRLHAISGSDLGTTKAALFPVDLTCTALSVATVSEKPGILKLQIPNAKNWSSGEAANPQSFIDKPAHGEWSAQWSSKESSDTRIQFSASAQTDLYPLLFKASPLPASPVEFDANDPRLALSLYNGSDPVLDARVEARFDFERAGKEKPTAEHATVSLLDDGKHGDGNPGDGIYTADFEALNFLAKEGAILKGTINVVVTGTLKGEPFRREIQSPFAVKRSAPPALLVSGTFDFGEKFAGETAASEVALRVRGSGGAFKFTLNATPESLNSALHAIELPTILKTKEKRAQRLELQVPELTPSGEYSGLALLELEGVAAVKVPWRVKVLSVDFVATPSGIELGEVYPGGSIKRTVRMATRGGALSLSSVTAPFLKKQPFDALQINKEGRDIELEFLIPETAQAMEIKDSIVFYDASKRERARIAVAGRVPSLKLLVNAKLDFGAVESGDVLKRGIGLKWDAGARISIVPKMTLSGFDLKPELSALVQRDGGWQSTFELTVPATQKSGDVSGPIRIDAGPYKTDIAWSARVIKPSISTDAAALDFGRVFPSRHAERTLVLSTESARPIEAELSITRAFQKPHVTGVALPESAVTFAKKITIAPGEKASIPFVLTLPDDAQDGRYETTLSIISRLGKIEIPMSVKAVNVVDAAAFHVAPTSMTFKIVEGEVLPSQTLQIVSHDDEPLSLVLDIPTPPPAPVEADPKPIDPAAVPPPPPAPVAFLYIDAKQAAPLSTLTISVPPRGTASVVVRPRADARDGDESAIRINGAGEHQEVDLHIQRFVGSAATLAPPEPPKLLNWIVALIVLVLIVAGVLAKYFIKNSGVRFVCYAAIVHLIIFSLAMPQKAIMEALPESIEVSLLDAQESLGISLSDQQARRLDALHSGGGAGDETRAPVLAQAALPEKNGPVELPSPGAGPASPRPSALNLDAARGVEHPVRAADVPEPARGAPTAPMATDAPLDFGADKPVVAAAPAKAEKFSPAAPRAAEVSDLQPSADSVALPASFASVEVSQRAPAQPISSSNIARNVVSENIDRHQRAPAPSSENLESARRSAVVLDDAPLNVAGDAPLTFDKLPAATPEVKSNPKVSSENLQRNIPVSASEAGLGAPGLGTLESAATPVVFVAGEQGLAGAGAGESRVAMARTSALPVADFSAGFGSRTPEGLGAAANGESNAGTGYGREGGGLPSGGQEPLAIGTNGADGPGAKIDGNAGGSGSGSGDGKSIVGGMKLGNGTSGAGGSGGHGGSGDRARTTAAVGGGGLGGIGSEFASGGSGKGTAEFGLPNGSGREWHGRSGGKGGGISVAPGLSSTQLETMSGNGNGNGTGGNGVGGVAASGAKGGNGGALNGTGFGPGGRLPGGFGANGEGPGGMGDKPMAIGPVGGGGIKPNGSGIASGGGDAGGHGGGGGYGIGRTGPVGGTSLDGGGGLGGVGNGGWGAGGVAGGNGRPGASNGKSVSIARGFGSKDLEDGGGQKSKSGVIIAGPSHRGIGPAYTGGMIRIAVGLAKHSGDWNSSPIALKNLRGAFIERSRLPELEVTLPTVELNNLSEMKKCCTIMMTSNLPVKFSPQEIDAIREFIAGGGVLWVNDSTERGDDVFDSSFRPQIALLVPNAKLERMPIEHDFFTSCYDLSHGYKGYRIPPGDKYRLDYMEAAFLPEPTGSAQAPAKIDHKNVNADVVDLAENATLKHRRAGIIYTRNDYSDGLQQNPLTNDGMDSLTDLTKSEMLEGSLRFGMNLIAYSMGPQGLKLPPPPDTVAEFEKVYRYKGPALPVLDDFSVLIDQWNKPTWAADSKEYFNESRLEFVAEKAEKAKLAKIDCKPGKLFKAAVTRFGNCDFSHTRALVFDIQSDFTHGINVALMFYSKDKSAYESRTVFVRPGWNRNMRFPLDMGDMKSSVSKVPWQNYDTPFEPRGAIERISVLIYNLNEAGTVKVGPLHEQK